MIPFEYFVPTKICFGRGAVRRLDTLVGEEFQRILLVTENNVAEKTGAVDAASRCFQGRHLTLFRDVEENPSFETLEKGRMLARDANPQLVMGIGGGSPMDAAKGIAVLAANEGTMPEYMAGRPLESDPLPVICVPTTAGSGSEVTPFAVFTDREGEAKGGYAHEKIFPRVSVIDPELTHSMPEAVVVNTGLDVLTHSIEAYLSTLAFPMNDLGALESIRLVLAHLKKATGKDREAMDAMAYASMLGGMAITHASTILLHILGYPLTVFHGVPHGRANAALLPAFLDFMRDASEAGDRVRILDGLFEPHGGVGTYVRSLGVSTHLTEYGVREDQLGMFAEKVIVKGDVKITPAAITREIIAGIYASTM